jgi:anthranilate synthase component 1
MVPVVRHLAADTLTPVTAYAAIARPPFGFLLESLVGGERWARYTFLGTEPSEAWRYREGMAERWTAEQGWAVPEPVAEPLTHIAEQVRGLDSVRIPQLPRFAGGAVGYLGYDVVRTLERLPDAPADDLALPDAVFMLADTLVVIDNAFARATVIANTRIPRHATAQDVRRAYDGAVTRIERLLERLAHPPHLQPLRLDAEHTTRAESPYSQEAFERDVSRIKEYIRAGDAYQVVLSRRQDLDCAAKPLDVYRSLRALNPAPYLYFVALDDLTLAGSSPEVLVRVEDGDVTVRPIAGTRPRGRRPADDAHLAEELLSEPWPK